VIENAADLSVPTWLLYVDPNWDADVFAGVRALWLRKIADDPTNRRLLSNARDVLQRAYPELCRDLEQRLATLDEDKESGQGDPAI
jgi:hypothetical protein